MKVETISSRALLSGLSFCLVVVFYCALIVGPVDISIVDALMDWFQKESTIGSLILFDIRLPRALLALFIGATLGLAGAALQGLLRNPLAEPGIISWKDHCG